MIDDSTVFSLSYYCPQERQDAAIKYLIDNADNFSEEDIGSLLERGCQDTYINTVKVLSAIGYPKISKAIPKLFELFQDLNWLGSMEAFELLYTLPPEAYISDLNNTIKEALDTDDECWVHGIEEFIYKANIAEKIDKELYRRFMEAYDRYFND